MELDFEKIKEVCTRLHADRMALIDVKQMIFRTELREMCKSNTCGRYGTNWACPPAIGEFEEAKQKVLKYNKAVIVQTVYKLEDSFDFEGMVEAKKVFQKIFHEIAAEIKNLYPQLDTLALGAGGCEYCEKCTYIENKPCRFPEQLISPIEGHGVDVTALANTCGIPYNNGVSTVAYIGAVLLQERL